jgi:hypothetical protein
VRDEQILRGPAPLFCYECFRALREVKEGHGGAIRAGNEIVFN